MRKWAVSYMTKTKNAIYYCHEIVDKHPFIYVEENAKVHQVSVAITSFHELTEEDLKLLSEAVPSNTTFSSYYSSEISVGLQL